MSKKRIFIGMHYLEIGGAESSLIGLLQSLDYGKVDVDLFIFSHQGAFMKLVPKETHLLPEHPIWALTEKDFGYCLKHGHFRMAWALLMVRMRLGLYVRRHHLTDFASWFSFMGDEVSPVLPDLDGLGEYDLSISFCVPHKYVLDHVKAKKRACWIHTDYSTIKVNKDLELPTWLAYDYVVSISDDVTKTFLPVFPELKDKIVKIENILSPRFVRVRAEEFVPEEYRTYLEKDTPIICSAGRVCYQKNYDNIPKMASELKKLGKDFHWFIVGPGDATAIMTEARQLGVDSLISFIGPRANPYPYIKHCTVYAQPSRFEGKSVVVREAQILQKPVLITNYPTASSQVTNEVDGIIVELDNKAVAKGLAQLIDDKDICRKIVSKLAANDYGNAKEVEKIYGLMEEK